MRTFYWADSTSAGCVQVQSRLEACGLTLASSAEQASVLVLAVGAGEGEDLASVMESLRGREAHGVLAVLLPDALPEDWRAAALHVPQAVSVEASALELSSRFDVAREARRRQELSFAGERRLQLLRQSLEEVSMIDMRTGMYNRRFLVTRLREALAASRRYARPLSLCLFRIDDYDAIERLEDGEALGGVLESLVDQLEGSKRSADVLAWIARDEFALLLPETGEDGAKIVARRVEAAARTLSVAPGRTLVLHSCVAVPKDGEASAEEFIEEARKLFGS